MTRQVLVDAEALSKVLEGHTRFDSSTGWSTCASCYEPVYDGKHAPNCPVPALQAALTQPQPSSSAGEIGRVLGLLARYVDSRERANKAGRTQEAYTVENDPSLLQMQVGALDSGKLRALAAQQPQPGPEPTEWEHVATKGRYVELCRAEVQAKNGPIHEGDWVVIYRALVDGRHWAQCFAREVQEFSERFTTPAAAQFPSEP